MECIKLGWSHVYLCWEGVHWTNLAHYKTSGGLFWTLWWTFDPHKILSFYSRTVLFLGWTQASFYWLENVLLLIRPDQWGSLSNPGTSYKVRKTPVWIGIASCHTVSRIPCLQHGIDWADSCFHLVINHFTLIQTTVHTGIWECNAEENSRNYDSGRNSRRLKMSNERLHNLDKSPHIMIWYIC